MACLPAGHHQLRSSSTGKVRRLPHHAHPQLLGIARLDERDYRKKVQVSDDELAAVNITPDPFHPEWNYTISPTPHPDPAG
jgi:hypothetical protein